MENQEQKRKEKVAEAVKSKKIIDDTSFTVFQMVEDLKEDVDQKITELRKEIQQDTSVDANVEKVALKLAVKLATLEKGDDGNPGSKFLGYYDNENELPDENELQKGDFAIVGIKGTIWYII